MEETIMEINLAEDDKIRKYIHRSFKQKLAFQELLLKEHLKLVTVSQLLQPVQGLLLVKVDKK